MGFRIRIRIRGVRVKIRIRGVRVKIRIRIKVRVSGYSYMYVHQ